MNSTTPFLHGASAVIDHDRARETLTELAGLAIDTDDSTAAEAYRTASQALLEAVGAEVLGDLDKAAEAMLRTKTALKLHTEAVRFETLHWLCATEQDCFEAWRSAKHETARRLRESGIDRYGKRSEPEPDEDESAIDPYEYGDALPGSVDDTALDGYGDS